MLYDIRLTITHTYATPAGPSRHLVRVLPAALPGRQRLNAHLTRFTPKPMERSDRTDFFGNRVTAVSHVAAHSEMGIHLTTRVEVTAPPQFVDVSPGLPELERETAQFAGLGPHAPTHYLGGSPLLHRSTDIANFARENTDIAQTVAANVLSLGRALYRDMTFDAAATTVDTDPADAFRNRRGVCQDLSHIMIIGLRALGIPAGYVSGYLRTLPPPGAKRLEGVDAMHAWVRAWCGPAQGWIEFDPTNDTLVGHDHIVVGYGRDYSDVSPVVGSLRAAGGQVSSQSVDVASVI